MRSVIALMALAACVAEPAAPTSGGKDTGAGGDSADSGESGVETGETGDSGDTGEDTGEDALAITTFGTADGVPNATWYGLSVAIDGSVWGATDQGLIHFDGTTTRIYTAVDGLLSDKPHSVLAHSDGTIWVGHLGDDVRQGEHLRVESDGSLTLIAIIDFTESSEITSIYRMREQPFGVGAGDVWMGTNEGLCVWDADLDVLAEHAHPVHPHSATLGVGFTREGDTWNADQYQLSRWQFSNDGDLSPGLVANGGDLLEYWVEWPVEFEEIVGSSDLDVDAYTVWVASSLYGVARVEAGVGTTGTSVTTLLPTPATATSIRVGRLGHVWVGSTDGLHLLDGETGAATPIGATWLPSMTIQQFAAGDRAMWIATPLGLVRVVGTPTE